jgi:phosphatidylglycerophosphate synthase
MCSKLGDFLDHGIDSFADPLAVLTIGLVMQGGVSLPIWQFLLSIVLVCFMNYIYLWSDKHTKVCFVSDVQLEAYIFFSIIFAITGLFGEKVWLYDLSSLLPSQGQEMIPHTVPLGMVLIMLALLLPITEYYDSFSRVIKVAGSFSPFIELLPPAMLAVGLVLWGTFSPSHICENQRLEISLLAISLFSLVTGRYNLARLTGEKVTLGWECYAFLVMATAISILKIDDSMILPLSVVIATLDAIHFYCSTTMEIASILHVPIFGMKQATKVKVNPVKVVETKEDLAMVACGLNTSPTMR